MAPEQFSKQYYDPFRAEIYTLGVLLFHIIYKAYPYQTNSSVDLNARNPNLVSDFEKSDKNTYKVSASPELVQLLTQMLAFDPEKRITLDDIVLSHWCQYQYKNILYGSEA